MHIHATYSTIHRKTKKTRLHWKKSEWRVNDVRQKFWEKIESLSAILSLKTLQRLHSHPKSRNLTKDYWNTQRHRMTPSALVAGWLQPPDQCMVHYVWTVDWRCMVQPPKYKLHNGVGVTFEEDSIATQSKLKWSVHHTDRAFREVWSFKQVPKIQEWQC